MKNKDAFTDIVENLPESSNDSRKDENKPKNQQVLDSEGNIVTLGVEKELKEIARLITQKLRRKDK